MSDSCPWPLLSRTLKANNVDLGAKGQKLSYNPKIFIALSSEEYGQVAHGTVINEDHHLVPISPYGVSKVAVDVLAKQYFESYGLNVYRIRR